MDASLGANGYENDFSDTLMHHEIYLTDFSVRKRKRSAFFSL